MEFKWFMIGLVCIMGMVSIGMGQDQHNKSKQEIEFAKAGLQQCQYDAGWGKIRLMWKKECK